MTASNVCLTYSKKCAANGQLQEGIDAGGKFPELFGEGPIEKGPLGVMMIRRSAVRSSLKFRLPDELRLPSLTMFN